VTDHVVLKNNLARQSHDHLHQKHSL